MYRRCQPVVMSPPASLFDDIKCTTDFIIFIVIIICIIYYFHQLVTGTCKIVLNKFVTLCTVSIPDNYLLGESYEAQQASCNEFYFKFVSPDLLLLLLCILMEIKREEI